MLKAQKRTACGNQAVPESEKPLPAEAVLTPEEAAAVLRDLFPEEEGDGGDADGTDEDKIL